MRVDIYEHHQKTGSKIETHAATMILIKVAYPSVGPADHSAVAVALDDPTCTVPRYSTLGAVDRWGQHAIKSLKHESSAQIGLGVLSMVVASAYH